MQPEDPRPSTNQPAISTRAPDAISSRCCAIFRRRRSSRRTTWKWFSTSVPARFFSTPARSSPTARRGRILANEQLMLDHGLEVPYSLRVHRADHINQSARRALHQRFPVIADRTAIAPPSSAYRDRRRQLQFPNPSALPLNKLFRDAAGVQHRHPDCDEYCRETHAEKYDEHETEADAMQRDWRLSRSTSTPEGHGTIPPGRASPGFPSSRGRQLCECPHVHRRCAIEQLQIAG